MVAKSKAAPDSGDKIRSQMAAKSSMATQKEHGRSLSQDTGAASRPNAGLGVSNPISRGKTTVARYCRKCGDPLVGQFVRALGSTYHLDCFRCRDCKTIVASKFFPMDEQRGQNRTEQYPLCERDYFRRLDLLCEACGEALRGSYITALDKKYHIEHFSCSVCPTVFGPQDSYYEHNGRVFCHFHYSRDFAARCKGCHNAILKQFVEVFRNGEDQHWHPECYMIHKFWNVRLASLVDESTGSKGNQKAKSLSSEEVLQREKETEARVYSIWSVLSAFEESSAACISDMLLHVSNGAYADGALIAQKFIGHVALLFDGINALDIQHAQESAQPLQYSREAKLLCKKIVAFFALLNKTQETGVRKLGVTQELLSLVTGLAHYLKVLIRIGLSAALNLEVEFPSDRRLELFLDNLRPLDQIESSKQSFSSLSRNLALSSEDVAADLCTICGLSIEDDCIASDTKNTRWHITCLKCSNCDQTLATSAISESTWNAEERKCLCSQCACKSSFGKGTNAGHLIYVSKLSQYVFLLRVALVRLMRMLKENNLSHTTDDPNLAIYDSTDGHFLDTPSVMRSNTRSKSYAGEDSESYKNTINDIQRLRATQLDQKLYTPARQARRSRILDGPQEDVARTYSSAKSPNGDSPEAQSKSSAFPTYRIEDDLQNDSSKSKNDMMMGTQTLTLDDISRIVAVEQAKEQRPNAFKHQKQAVKPASGTARLRNGSSHDATNDYLSKSTSRQTKRYLSELSALESFIVSHIAVLSLERLVEGHFNLEQLLSLIETRKTTFWARFGFKPKKGTGPVADKKKKGVFGVPLEVLMERSGADSSLGVGPGQLRIPGFVDDVIATLRRMDMSVEGVFRKNGNIRRLRDMAEAIDKSSSGTIDFHNENPVQLAALLKKFLRELPDPLLTQKLYKLWAVSQKMEEEETRKRVLHLICCLLPKYHRDFVEVLLCFLNWVASFSHVDEENGSKMDTHNLSTVITPNILYLKGNEGVDESFLAIEAVNTLIAYNDEFCMVPDDLLVILQDSSVFASSADLSTKDILKRCEEILPKSVAINKPSVVNGAKSTQSIPTSSSAASNKSIPKISKEAKKSKRGGRTPPRRIDTEIAQSYKPQHLEATVRHVTNPNSPSAFGSNPNSPGLSPTKLSHEGSYQSLDQGDREKNWTKS